jgi:hypothetical protein
VSVELLEAAAAALGALVDEVVVVGGASLGVWITDPFGARLRGCGFAEDAESGVICRWRHAATGLVLDAMPTDPAVFGFASRWQAASVPSARRCALPSGRSLRISGPVHLVAMKLEAHAARGAGDLFGSRDFADLIALVDGRSELVAEIEHAPGELRGWIAAAVGEMFADRRIEDGVAGAFCRMRRARRVPR